MDAKSRKISPGETLGWIECAAANRVILATHQLMKPPPKQEEHAVKLPELPFWHILAQHAHDMHNKGAFRLHGSMTGVQEIIPMSVVDFPQLSQKSREEILFAVAHAPSYRHYVVPLSPEVPLGWELEQYHKLCLLEGHEMGKVLQLYAWLKPHEKAVLTPTRVEKMTPEQRAHLIQIIAREEKTFAQMASYYNLLPYSQRAKLLELTDKEYAAMDKETKQELAHFLEVHAKERFNDLDPLTQAQWREKDDQTRAHRALSSLEDEYAAQKEVLLSLKKANAPLSSIAKVQKAVDDAEKKIPLLKKELFGCNSDHAIHNH
jgi:hypothetical protein